METKSITVIATINKPVQEVWSLWTSPHHIINWNFASPEWCCPSALNDLKPGGHFSWRMEAKDGSMGFDYKGTFDRIEANELIEYTLDDGRKVLIKFVDNGDQTIVTETFEPENMNSEELQKAGWQAILDNFKRYAESNPDKL